MVTDKIRIDYGGVSALPTASSSTPKAASFRSTLDSQSALTNRSPRLLDLPIAAKVETFADTGEIFLKHADRATLLPASI